MGAMLYARPTESIAGMARSYRRAGDATDYRGGGATPRAA